MITIRTLMTLIFYDLIRYYFLNKPNTALIVKKDNISVSEENVFTKYTNTHLGFSINIPKEITGVYRCSPVENFMVPVKVFEDDQNGMVYIAPEYYYEAKWDSNLLKYVGPCEKIYYSADMLRKETTKNDLAFSNLNVKTYEPRLGWAIVEKNVKNEEELGAVIKNMFGKGCDYTKTAWKEKDIYEISFGEKNTKGLTFGSGVCSAGYSYKLFYIPSLEKIIFIKIGQDCTFVDVKKNKCYIDKMIDSFFMDYK